MNREEKARIARENGKRSKGPKTEEGKGKSRRNAIRHGRRAVALQLIVAPHSICLANEDRQAFYNLFDRLNAKYRPDDDTEFSVVREIAENQWKIVRNKQMETAIFNRELVRQSTRVESRLPEMRDLEISIAAHEALAGNKTIAELRKDCQLCQRTIAQLQRRLAQLQKEWPGSEALPPSTEPERTLHLVDPDAVESDDERTNPDDLPSEPQPTEESTDTFDVNGAVDDMVVELYESIFHPRSFELIGHGPTPGPEAA